MLTAGNARLAVGRIKVAFAITGNSDVLTYGVLHTGDHNLNCGVRFDAEPGSLRRAGPGGQGGLRTGGFCGNHPASWTAILAAMHYSLKSLFRDEQHKVLNQILAQTRDEIYNTYRLLTDRYAPLTRFLDDIHAPPLNSLAPAAEFVLNTELQRQF